MYIFIYVLLLDINCQHLGNICHLEGFCAPFECRVGELLLGKFLGRHVPRWTSSQVDKFHKRQFPPVQVPKRTSSQWPGSCLGESCPGGTCLLATRNDKKPCESMKKSTWPVGPRTSGPRTISPWHLKSLGHKGRGPEVQGMLGPRPLGPWDFGCR